MKNVRYDEKIIEYIKTEKAVFLSDIAREFSISNHTASDIAKFLEDCGIVSVHNKGIAKLVIYRGNRNE